jgi:HSP20 family protein
MRSLTMPTNINADMIEAKHENGVLTVRLPKLEEDKSKKIAVKTITTNGNGKK